MRQAGEHQLPAQARRSDKALIGTLQKTGSITLFLWDNPSSFFAVKAILSDRSSRNIQGAFAQTVKQPSEYQTMNSFAFSSANANALLTILFTVTSMAACAQEAPAESGIFGTWARSQAECKRPELIFSKTSITISTDADGTPTKSEYKNIQYKFSPNAATVSLNERHPYSKTPEKEALQFYMLSANIIELQKSRGKGTQFLRCAK